MVYKHQMKGMGRQGAAWLVLGAVALFCSSDLRAEVSPDQQRSLGEIIGKLAHYRHNQDHDTILELEAYIRKHRQTPAGREDCESQLLGLLQGEATADGKWEACRQLRSLGSDASVPVLTEMLQREDTFEMARFALEKIPGTAADRALLAALRSSAGGIRLGIISSLGHRGSRPAVADLARIAGQPDEASAEAAIAALGRIATEEAALSLIPFLGEDRERLRFQAAASLMRCAEVLREAGEPDRAFPFYRQLLASDISLSLSHAALQGLISVSGAKGRDLILDVLKNEDGRLHAAAIGMIPRVFEASDILPLCQHLPQLPLQSRIQLISALSGFKNDMVLVTMAQSLSNPEPEVRRAALRALSRLGDGSTLGILVRHAARSRGDEQATAREALWNLKGEAVDDAILAALSQEEDQALKRELIRSVGERGLAKGKPLLFGFLQDPDPGIRVDAVRALRPLAEPPDLPLLIDRLLKLEVEAEQAELADTLAAAARKINRPYAQAGLVTNRLNDAESADDRRILLMVLGRIGDDSSLHFLRRALKDPSPDVQEAAARALIGWPTPAARDDVFWIAETSSHPTLQVLAVRAYVTMVGMERFRRPEAVVEALKGVLPLVKRSEEKMAILSVLPQFPCPAALELAESFLEDQGVEKEARAAADRLRRSIR